MPGDHEDQTLIMADVGRKTIAQVQGFVERMLQPRLTPERAREAARLMATGVWTHDHPLTAAELELIGLTVTVGIPSDERTLMELYPQPRGRTPAVEYVPGPSGPASPPSAGRGGS